MVDLFGGFQRAAEDWGPRFLNDGLHFTAEGNKKCLELVLEMIHSRLPHLRQEERTTLQTDRFPFVGGWVVFPSCRRRDSTWGCSVPRRSTSNPLNRLSRHGRWEALPLPTPLWGEIDANLPAKSFSEFWVHEDRMASAAGGSSK